ncbi:ornithine cyclodeaminase family protein [Brevibacillus sp. SYSU BS000544]|uniref:ornithine cyclodeaminase family protein n=1 Tax=Brevibacillus sp. SYSU BS000544 TaxID=3416443 RepID=UPI003CE47252
MLLLTGEDQRNLAKMEDVIEAVATALKEYSLDRTITPLRTSIPVEQANGLSLFMPAYVSGSEPGRESLGMKLVSVFPGNRELGKKTIYGIMVLIDANTGEPLALMDASYLTVVRTGAASGLATRHLARMDASHLTVIGTGAQASGLIEAILAVRPIQEIQLYNRSQAKAEAFAEEIAQGAAVGKQVRVLTDPDEAVAGADILVTATNAEHPVFSMENISRGMHINSIGAYRPTMQELPGELVAMADKVVVESREGALEETGDLVIPIAQGLFAPERIHAELGEIVAGNRAGRERMGEITLFKSVGLATMDIVVAKLLYDRAIQLGAGQHVSL